MFDYADYQQPCTTSYFEFTGASENHNGLLKFQIDMMPREMALATFELTIEEATRCTHKHGKPINPVASQDLIFTTLAILLDYCDSPHDKEYFTQLCDAAWDHFPLRQTVDNRDKLLDMLMVAENRVEPNIRQKRAAIPAP